MSASPMARQAVVSTQAIPIKRVVVNDPSEMPSHYSQTPGGTLFSTTPGGTKIVYERSFLLGLRNSPISNSTPTFDIPENLVKGSGSPPKKHYHNKPNMPKPRRNSNSINSNARRGSRLDEDQFEMDL